MGVILKAENISKQYRLGLVGTGTITHDLNRWWHTIRGKEDPYLKIGAVNDRSAKANSDYVWALQNINFEVLQGEVLGIIGKNGAGKSTLLKLLSRVTSPTTGIIKSRGRIASLLEVGTGFHPELTGRENIYLNGAILGMTKAEIASKIDEIVDFSGCEMYIDTPTKRYSSGMTVRLAFAVAAHLEPDILVVDEVLAVGDAEFQKKAIGKMQDISTEQGRTVLFVSHNMASVKQLCTRAIVLKNGSFDFNGTPEDAIAYYLKQEKQDILENIESIVDRSGKGHAIFNNFSIRNHKNEIVNTVLNDEEINFCFTVKSNVETLQNIDIGFSIHSNMGDVLSVLYSSFQTEKIVLNGKGYYTINCLLKNIPFARGTYSIRGRLLSNGTESDWPKAPIGILNIINGDFYKTGNLGFDGKAQFLIKGEWSKQK